MHHSTMHHAPLYRAPLHHAPLYHAACTTLPFHYCTMHHSTMQHASLYHSITAPCTTHCSKPRTVSVLVDHSKELAGVAVWRKCVKVQVVDGTEGRPVETQSAKKISFSASVACKCYPPQVIHVCSFIAQHLLHVS